MTQASSLNTLAGKVPGDPVCSSKHAEPHHSHALNCWLQDYYGFAHALLTARGASAIHTVLKALERPGTAVLVPATTCPAAVYPIVSAGYRPVFCDINLSDFNVDLAQLQDLRVSGGMTAMLAVHSFGHRFDGEAIRRWCSENGLFLIEDVCQFGGDTAFEPVGDALIASFGHTKLLDVGTGGALLTNDARLHQAAIAIESGLPLPTPGLENAYRQAYYSHLHAVRSDAGARTRFRILGSTFADLFAHRIDSAKQLSDRVMPAVAAIDRQIETRRNRFILYSNAFSGLPLILPEVTDESVPWRYTFLTSDSEDTVGLTAHLRHRQFHASNWYRCLADDWAQTDFYCVNSRYFESRVINLWLAEGVDDGQVSQTCEQVLRYFDEPKTKMLTP